MRESLSHEFGERAAIQRGAVDRQHRRRVGGVSTDSVERGIASEQTAVRLNCARDVDRLAVAIREIDSCCSHAIWLRGDANRFFLNVAGAFLCQSVRSVGRLGYKHWFIV